MNLKQKVLDKLAKEFPYTFKWEIGKEEFERLFGRAVDLALEEDKKVIEKGFKEVITKEIERVVMDNSLSHDEQIDGILCIVRSDLKRLVLAEQKATEEAKP